MRHLGFSAHHAPAAIRLMDALELDSVLFPVNVNAWERGGFGPQILAKAKSKGMARMALEGPRQGPLAVEHSPRRIAPRSAGTSRSTTARWLTSRCASRFNQDITAAVPPGDEKLWDLAAEFASQPLAPLAAAELAQLKTHVSVVEPVFQA